MEIKDYINDYEADVYDLSQVTMFDTTCAIGLYREEPKKVDGILEMLNHTNKVVILTYFAEEKGRVPDALNIKGSAPEFIDHTIDERLEIVRIWKT